LSKWNKELLKKEALKYSTITEFSQNNLGAYSTVKKRYAKDKEYIFSHFKRPKKQKKWTIESIKKVAECFDSISDFRKEERNVYNKMFYLKEEEKTIIRNCFKIKHRRKWTLEKIKKEALKYKHRVDFKNNSNLSYETMLKYHQAEKEDIMKHMIKKSSGYSYDEPAILYYLSVNDGYAYKIGVTNRTVEQRYSNEDLAKIKIIKISYYKKGIDAQRTEQRILKDFNYARLKNEKLLKDGNTELFSFDVLGLDKDNHV